MKNKQPIDSGTWLLVLGIILLYILAAAVEPCDGHSCKGEQQEAADARQ